MKKLMTIIIGFIHDFAAGCWTATVFAVFWLDRQGAAYDLIDVFTDLKKQFFYIGLVCVFIVMATGAGRSFTYASNVYGEDAEKTRRRMLIYKHIILFVVFGLGIWWQYLMTFN